MKRANPESITTIGSMDSGPAPSGASRNDDVNGVSSALLVLRRLALDKSLAALHLVGQRRFVDLDHDGIGVDAQVLHQRLRDVAHHAGLLFVGAAGGHADGDFRHFCLSFFSVMAGTKARSASSR